MSNTTNQIELKVELSKRLRFFPDSSFGVYSFKPLTNKHMVNVSDWGNFVATGSVPEMFEGREYEIIIEPTKHPKYGDGYNIVTVKHKPLTTAQEQFEYIKVMLKESQYEAIKARYPNEKVIDLIKEDKFDWKSIKGFGEKTYEKVKNYLLQNLDIQEALIELRDLKLTFKAMKKLVMHYGSANVVVEKIKESIYNLLEVDGFGFAKVDQYAIARGDSKTSSYRIVAAIQYILEQEEQNGHSWITKDSIIIKAKELLQIEESYIINILNKEQNKEKSKFYITEDIIALYKNYNYERLIKKHLFEILNAETYIKVDDIENKIKEVEKEQGFKFTEEQKEIFHLINKHNVVIVNGKAGTGKTASLKGALAGAFKDYQHICCALSGKAAKIITERGLNGSTIHRMLKIDPSTGKFTFNYKERLPYDIVVIDESSMCNIYLFYSVVSAVKKGAKLIIQGDSEQLPAISAGSVFYDLLQAGVFPQKELTIIQRQAQKSGILSVANAVRDGKQINGRNNYQKQVYGELKDLHLIPLENRENIKDVIIDICKRYKGKDFYEFQVLVGLKQRGDISAKTLNIELQKIFNDINKPFVRRGGYDYREGDKIIQNGNVYNTGENEDINIYNGTIGIIQYISNDSNGKTYVGIKFEGIDEIIEYEGEELDSIELAYAITVHKSQGSTIKHVIFAFDYSAYLLLSRQFVYTGITRASKGCVVVCENKALSHAIRINHSGNRNTFLYSMLMDGNI